MFYIWNSIDNSTRNVSNNKRRTKIVAKDVLTGWNLNLGNQIFVNMDLPPQQAFVAHIGLNIAIGRDNIKRTNKRANDTLENLIRQTGLTSNQLDDIMKYTGKKRR